MRHHVYDFGGKGAGRAETTRLSLPVPPGFAVTTEACRARLAAGREPDALDEELTDRLVHPATAEGRASRPGPPRGGCGGPGGDPDSLSFFHEAGIDHVSCSPHRTPVARLETGRAALTTPGTATGTQREGER